MVVALFLLLLALLSIWLSIKHVLSQCCSINKLTLVANAVFFHVTEIIIVQLMLKHV